MKRTCSVSGCSKPVSWNGFCQAHHSRFRKYGDALASLPIRAPTPSGLPARWIEDNVSYTGDDCLPWPFARHAVDGRASYGHRSPTRMMCEAAHGPAQRGMLALHVCGNGHKACMNPRHLRWGTPQENMDDMVAHGRGERTGRRLLEQQALTIKMARGRLKASDLCKEFSVNPKTIYDIWAGKSWKSLPFASGPDGRTA